MVVWPLTLTMTLLMTSPSCAAEEVEVVSGILTELLPLPTIYETFVPILLEYKLPSLSKENMSALTWVKEDCSTSDYQSDSICPTAFYLGNEVDDFFNFLNEMNPRDSDNVSNEILESNNLDISVLRSINWNNLEESVKMFKDTRTMSKDIIEDYLTKSIKNPQVPIYYMARNMEYFSHTKTDNIQTMLNRFRTAYWENINSDRIDEALLSNAMSIYQNMILQKYLMESFRWSQAESECRLHKLIPKTIVSKNKIENALVNLSLQLKSHNHSYSLSIPVNDIQQYYSEKLASCVFTQDSFLVTILVPLHSQNVDNLRFIKVHNVPFITPSPFKVCQVQIENSHYFQDTKSGFVQVSTCQPGQLCPVQPMEFNFNSPCISTGTILQGNEEESHSIVKYCDLTCKDFSRANELPLINKISNDTFVVTGTTQRNDGMELVLNCPESEDQIISTFNVGAALIKLPNGCRLLFKNLISLQVDTEDMNLFSYGKIHQILPIHWIANGILGQFPKSSLNISVNLEKSQSISGGNFGTSSENCSISECTPIHYSSSGTNGFIVTAIFVLAAIVISCFVFLFMELRKLKFRLDYGSEDYKEFVAYKNETVRCSLFESD